MIERVLLYPEIEGLGISVGVTSESRKHTIFPLFIDCSS